MGMKGLINQDLKKEKINLHLWEKKFSYGEKI